MVEYNVKDFAGQFGEHFRRWRKDHKISQRKVGSVVGVTKDSISNLERGIFTPRADLLIKLTLLMGWRLDELAFLVDMSKVDEFIAKGLK
jgi:transcriptional regulator with XRE-family HTH domain